MKYTSLLLLLFLLLLSLIACQTETNTESEKPNILLIIVDDQGYADFSPFEKHDKTVSTPNISRLGNAGTVFTQAYVTAPVCSPSRVGILTGKNQFRWDKPASWGPGLPDDIKTLPEYLLEAGYTTACILYLFLLLVRSRGKNFSLSDILKIS